MVPAPPNVSRHFLSWNRPLLGQAVSWLARDWTDGPLDLSSLLVIVPTAQSGRRLREAIAQYAADRGRGAIPPRVGTPDALISPSPDSRTASRLESLLAWARVLQALDLEEARAVFPVDPPSRTFSWALRVGAEFLSVQAALAEGGLRCADVATRAGDFPEAERWGQLGALEQAYDGKLALQGARDGQAAKIAAARHPGALPGVTRIVLLATPDPTGLALEALAARAGTLPIESVVFAPSDDASLFDSWGAPEPAAWAERTLELPDFERQVRLCADPAAQAEAVAALARRYPHPEGLLAIGAVDPEVAQALESALRGAGFAVFNPEGRPRRQDELYHLLAALADLAREPTFAALESLGRCPAFIDHLRAVLGDGFSAADWLAGMDELGSRHLPSDLDGALAAAAGLAGFPRLAPALEEVRRVRGLLAEGAFADAVTRVAQAIFASRPLNLADPADAAFADSAEAWAEAVRGCAAAGSLPAEEAWELALLLFGESVAAGDRPAGAVEVQGWLELLWEDAPHLAVAGTNDGNVPEAIAGDAFLPESLRQKLGLKTNARRFARDAYLLAALGACRAAAGRLDILFGKVSAAGEPLRPSRLLLRCADADLPGRVAFLFRPIEAGGPPLAWNRAWKLNLRRRPEIAHRAGPPRRVAVTALRDWLACPFRFYLRHVLRLAPFDAGKEELDDLDFGTLCHAALEAMGRDAALRDCSDAALLRDFLTAELDRRVAARFGASLAVPLVIQREAARQRLGVAASLQAAQRAEGWRIEAVERTVALEVGGLPVSGKIDRVDRHERTGEIRVLDYKTSDSARTPDRAHFRLAGSRPPARPWAGFSFGGKSRVWADLQLPFYRHALAAEYPQAPTCGYFNLPRAAGEAGVALWVNYPPDLHAAAVRCVEGVCAAIQAEEFWPPTEDVPEKLDDFAELFHHGAAASVDWEGLS